ncbi:hypothetical protein [Micromonospora fluostatini]|uniref:hypothetical protein n=1 Tax=Micromonospora sp. JCM 30529 TaxID=3421643 RepID=UPI003D174E8E
MGRSVDVHDLVTVSWRRGLLPLLGLCAGLAAAQAATPALPARYEAQASVLVVASPPDGDRPAELSLALAQNLAPTVAKLVGSREVAVDAARALSLPEQAVAGHVKGSFEPGLQIITVRASAGSGKQAAAIANAASRAIGGQLARLKLGGDTAVTTRVVDTASPPSVPAFPKPLLNSALGALLGLLAGWGATVLRERFDSRLRDVVQMESRLGLPVVGVLPPLPRRFARHHAAALYARREVADATRVTVSALSMLTAPLKRRRLLVTGVVGDDNGALVTALLGLGMAAEHRRVTLVDGTVRDPLLAGHFPDAPFTWQQVLADGRAPAGLPGTPTLTVLPTEPQESLSAAHTRELGDLLDRLEESADSVVVHAPPVLAGCDTAALARHVDGVLLVVVAGQTAVTAAVRAARLLRRLDLPLVGVVAVGAVDRVDRRPDAGVVVDGVSADVAERTTGRAGSSSGRGGDVATPVPVGRRAARARSTAACGQGAPTGPEPAAFPAAATTPAPSPTPPGGRAAVAPPLVPPVDEATELVPTITSGRARTGSALGRPLARAESGVRTVRAATGRVPIESVPTRPVVAPRATRYVPPDASADPDPWDRQPEPRRWAPR